MILCFRLAPLIAGTYQWKYSLLNSDARSISRYYLGVMKLYFGAASLMSFSIIVNLILLDLKLNLIT
jgi:hypothetical protein